MMLDASEVDELARDYQFHRLANPAARCITPWLAYSISRVIIAVGIRVLENVAVLVESSWARDAGVNNKTHIVCN